METARISKMLIHLYCTRRYIALQLTYLLTYLLIYLLTPWSSVPSWEADRFQLVTKFPAFYETRRFIAAFTTARHLSLSWDSSIKSMTPHPISWRSVLILSSHLRLDLPSGLFPLGSLRQLPLPNYILFSYCLQPSKYPSKTKHFLLEKKKLHVSAFI